MRYSKSRFSFCGIGKLSVKTRDDALEPAEHLPRDHDGVHALIRRGPVGRPARGLIGQSLGSGFTRLLGVSGSLLVQVVLIVAGLSLLLQVSWLTLLEKAGAQLEWLWYRLIRQPHQFVRDIPNAKFARRMVRTAKTITAEEVETVEGASSNRKPVAVQINQPAGQGLPEKQKPAPERQKDLFAPKRQAEDGEYLLPELDLLARPQEHTPEINSLDRKSVV